MSAQNMWNAIGMLRRGVVAGVLTFAGFSVAADNPDWFGYGIAGAATLVVVGKVAGANQRARELDRRGRDATVNITDVGAGRFTQLEFSVARPVSIETTRDLTVPGDQPVRSARLGVLLAEDRYSPQDAYLTYGQRDIEGAGLSVLEREHIGVSVASKDAGSIVLTETSEEPPTKGFGRVDDLPPDLRLPGRPRRRGRGWRATVAFCAAFAVAGTTTGALMPNTAEVPASVVREVQDILGVHNYLDDPDDELRRLLAAADAAVPGSSARVREVDLSETSASLTVHDPEAGKDFAVSDYDSEPDYESALISSRGTLDFSGETMPSLTAMRDAGAAGLTGVGNVTISSISVDAGDAEPGDGTEGVGPVALTYQTAASGSRTIYGKADGTLAPLFAPQDMDQAYHQLGELLRHFDIDPDAAVLTSVSIRSSLGSSTPIGSNGLDSAGGVEVTVVDPERGFGTLRQTPGVFPTQEEWREDPYPEHTDVLQPFALTDFTSQRLAELIAFDAKESRAEQVDVRSVSLEIAPVKDGSVRATMQLGELASSRQTYGLIAAR